MNNTTQLLANFDQNSKMICESFPAFWWGMYSGMVDQGFTKEQAIDILKVYIASITAGSK